MDPDFTTCPYNPSHRVLKLRLQYHILRCRQNYHGPLKKPCPFNATHLIPIEEYTKHVLSCNDARLIEGHRYTDHLDAHGTFASTRYHFPISQGNEWESRKEGKCASTQPARSTQPAHIGSTSQSHQHESAEGEHFFDYDEHEEPLQGYFYLKRHVVEKESYPPSKESLENGAGKTDNTPMVKSGGLENDMADVHLGEANWGRGRFHRLLEIAARHSHNTEE